jgi:hypothetical protein
MSGSKKHWTSPQWWKHFFNELVDLKGFDTQAEVKIVKADQEVQEGILDRMPEGKRLQVIMGRSVGDANEKE